MAELNGFMDWSRIPGMVTGVGTSRRKSKQEKQPGKGNGPPYGSPTPNDWLLSMNAYLPFERFLPPGLRLSLFLSVDQDYKFIPWFCKGKASGYLPEGCGENGGHDKALLCIDPVPAGSPAGRDSRATPPGFGKFKDRNISLLISRGDGFMVKLSGKKEPERFLSHSN